MVTSAMPMDPAAGATGVGYVHVSCNAPASPVWRGPSTPRHMAPDPCEMQHEGDAGGPGQLCVTAAGRPQKSLRVRDSETALRPVSSTFALHQERAAGTPGHVPALGRSAEPPTPGGGAL